MQTTRSPLVMAMLLASSGHLGDTRTAAEALALLNQTASWSAGDAAELLYQAPAHWKIMIEGTARAVAISDRMR